MTTGLFTARTILLHLLFRAHEEGRKPLATAALSTICGILNASPTDLEPGKPLPSTLESPVASSHADAGPSSSPAPRSTWTLTLLLPLLKLCADPRPQSQSQTQLQPIVQLVSRVLSIVEPYPAPPFDVGLEVSQMMGQLPEVLAVPLRQSLSGLMMDLAMSDGASRNQAFNGGDSSMPSYQQQQQQQASVGGGPSGASGSAELSTDIKFPSPAESFAPFLSHAIALLVSAYRQTRPRERHADYTASPPSPNPGLIRLLKLSWRICDSSDVLLNNLLSAIVSQAVSAPPNLDGPSIDAFVMLVEELPEILHWWKTQQSPRLSFPDTVSVTHVDDRSRHLADANQEILVQALRNAFEANKTGLDAHSEWQTTTWTRLTSHDDNEDENGSFSPLDGWSVSPSCLLFRLSVFP